MPLPSTLYECKELYYNPNVEYISLMHYYGPIRSEFVRFLEQLGEIKAMNWCGILGSNKSYFNRVLAIDPENWVALYYKYFYHYDKDTPSPSMGWDKLISIIENKEDQLEPIQYYRFNIAASKRLYKNEVKDYKKIFKYYCKGFPLIKGFCIKRPENHLALSHLNLGDLIDCNLLNIRYIDDILPKYMIDLIREGIEDNIKTEKEIKKLKEVIEELNILPGSKGYTDAERRFIARIGGG